MMTGARNSPWLLVSDIDDTLTGDDAALSRLAEAVIRNRDRLCFAVNSSRPSGSVAETLRDDFPPNLVPDAIITALGTEITVGGKRLPPHFSDWPGNDVFEALAVLGHRPHAAKFQTAYKVSFAVPPDAQPEARQALAPFECQIIASGSDDFDVIPPGAGKGAATVFLAGELGYDLELVVAAGDSGNDVAMMKAVPNRIVVGNARSELVAALPPGTFFHARGHHAAGVLEGLVEFGIIPPPDY